MELRLWEALERGLLSPFQYFGVHDATDLQHISWRRGRGYDAAELTNVYTGHDARTRIVLQVLAQGLGKVPECRFHELVMPRSARGRVASRALRRRAAAMLRSP